MTRAHLEPFNPGARRSYSPASADLCFFLFCVRPFGAICPCASGFVFFFEPIWSHLSQAPAEPFPHVGGFVFFFLFCVRPFGATFPKVLKMTQNRVKIGQNLLKMTENSPKMAQDG